MVISNKYNQYLKKVIFSHNKKVAFKAANRHFVLPIAKCISRVVVKSQQLSFLFIVLKNCKNEFSLNWTF